jgi:hypothetical protein
LDAAPLIHLALYQLFAAVLLLDGHDAHSATACRDQILASEGYRELFADVVDDLPLLDELSGSFDRVLGDPQAPRERFLRLMKRMPKVHRKVRAHFDAKLRADGARARPTMVFGILGLIVVAALAGVMLYRSWPARQAHEGDAQSTGQPSAGGSAVGTPQHFEGRCFEATFFSDIDFQTPVHIRRDCQIAFDWGEGSVLDVPSLPADSFSVRWEGVLEPPRSGQYRFHLTSDDGSRLYLDSVLVVDNWGAHGPLERSSEAIDLEAGAEVPIVVEYFELDEVAQVKLAWSSLSMEKQPLSGQYVRPHRARRPPGGDATAGEATYGPSDCFVGRYFVGRDLKRLVHERRDCRIAFDWGSGPPTGVEGMPEDDFSVRWEGILRVPATDEYVFYLGSDDGSRLSLGGEELLGDWTEHGFGFLQSAPTELTQGIPYPIAVEFFDAKELAIVRLEWSSPTLPRQPLSGRYVSVPPG